MGRNSSVSDKMRSLALLLVVVLFIVSVEASQKVNGKPFRLLRKKIVGNIKDRFKLFKNNEDGAEILNAVDEDTSENDRPKPMTTPATSSSFSGTFGYNIAERVTLDWGAMEQSLLTMHMNEYTRGLVQELVDANPCVNSLVAYNSMMGGGAKLLIDNGPLIENMVTSLLSLRGERNMTILLGESASLMRDLDQILPLFSYFMCQSDPKVSVSSLRETALVLNKMSYIDNVPFLVFTTPIREGLRWSAELTEALSNWVDHFVRNMEVHDCYTSEDGLGDVIQQMVYNMKDVADIFGVLGQIVTGKEIRSYSTFVKSIKESISDSPEYSFPGFCGLNMFRKVGEIMDDMTSIIGEVGLTRLSSQLGISFRLDLLPQ